LTLSRKSKGFSLIEVLIALVILSISLLALAGLMVHTTKSNSWGGHMTEATTFAQDTLEHLRVTPWANLVPGADVITGATGINYNRAWNVATDADGNLRTITVNVTWNDGISHSISFLSAVTQ
jgi:type IV pilus modification protein PilV